MKKILSGDLDIILLKALRKEPDRRYNTANGLRSDLIRWLSGERILARPDSVGYQVKRLVRRHPLVVTMLVTILVGTAGFTRFHVQRITTEEFESEIGRCFSCGLCYGCERCWMFCTPGCFKKVPDGEPGNYYSFNESSCDGCNKCRDECPCGFIDMS